MIFIPGVGSGGNPNPVGSGWDPGFRVGSGGMMSCYFFLSFSKSLKIFPGNIPREHYATAPRWKFRNIFVNAILNSVCFSRHNFESNMPPRQGGQSGMVREGLSEIAERNFGKGDTKLVTGPRVSSAIPHLRVAEYSSRVIPYLEMQQITLFLTIDKYISEFPPRRGRIIFPGNIPGEYLQRL